MKEVLGYKRYASDESGEIWDLHTNQILKYNINGGFKRCRMVKDGSVATEWVKVHRAVALAYIEKPHGAKKVIQIDRDKLNTHPSNLCWYVARIYVPKVKVEKPTPVKKVKPYPKYKLKNLHRAIREMITLCLAVEAERKEYCKVKVYKNSKRVMDIPWEAVSSNTPYMRWSSMWYRVDSRKSSYEEVNIHDSWVLYSNFKVWWEEHYVEGYHLDKDLLSKDGESEYGPDTCCFLPSHLNTTLSGMRYTDRLTGTVPTKNGTYATVSQSEHYGTYKSELDAHLVWIGVKRAKILHVASMYELPERSKMGIIALTLKMDTCVRERKPLMNYGTN